MARPDTAEVHTPTPTTNPNEAAALKLGEEVAAANAAGIAAERAAASQLAAAGIAAQAPDPGRPAWLPEKFKSPDDLAKAYAELESKLGAPKAAPVASDKPAEIPAKPAAPTTLLSETELQAFTAEFVERGDLSADSYQKLEAKGIPKAIAAAYVEGQKATRATAVAGVYATVGGEENYKAAVEWARDTLPPADIDAFNKIVRTGDPGVVGTAVAGLYARFQVAGGRPVGAPAATRVSGTQTPGLGSVAPFGSADEVVMAMRSPMYRQNPAYRAWVEQRLAASKDV